MFILEPGIDFLVEANFGAFILFCLIFFSWEGEGKFLFFCYNFFVLSLFIGVDPIHFCCYISLASLE